MCCNKTRSCGHQFFRLGTNINHAELGSRSHKLTIKTEPHFISKLKCGLINARSVVNKLDSLKLRMMIEELDVIGITESWAHKDIDNSELHIDGYNMFRKDRPSRGGGVILYVKEHIPCKLLDSKEDIESIWCEIGDIYSKCNIALYYRPPNASESYNKEMCKELLDYTRGKTVIIGDFNFPEIDWESFTAPKGCEFFRDTCLDLFLSQHVKDHTREKHILDLVLTSYHNLLSDVEVAAPLANSDHNIVTFYLKLSSRKAAVEKCRPCFHKANFVRIRESLSSVDWSNILRDQGVNNAWNIFYNILKVTVDSNVPFTSVNRKRKPGLVEQ